MIDEYKAKRLREMLETTDSTGLCPQLLHPTAPNPDNLGALELDADALRVLIAHYELQRINRTRPAWLEPESIDYPSPPRRVPEEMRE